MTYNILDYGAKDSQTVLSTKAIQNAIDDCSMAGGGTVLIPCGKYVCGSVVLKDNVHVYFENGATLLGAEVSDFDKDEKRDYKFYQDLSHSTFNVSMFRSDHVNNVKFSGFGTIDMRSKWDEDDLRGQGNPDLSGRAAKIFALRESSNIVITDLTLLNATDLAVYLAGCTDVRISGLKIRTHIDGISPDSCKNVIISDCNVETGDDAIVLKSSYTLNRIVDSENIVITNCIVSSRSNAIKFGTESNGGLKNLTVSNCVLRDTMNDGIAIESNDGGIVDGVYVNNIIMQNVRIPIFVCLLPRLRGPEGTKVGKVKNINISNVYAHGPYVRHQAIPANLIFCRQGNSICQPWVTGYQEKFELIEETVPWQPTSNFIGCTDQPIENLSLSNVHLVMRGGAKGGDYTEKVPEYEKGMYPEGDMFSKNLPAKGMYFRHVNGVSLRDITVETELDDVREEFVFEDVKNLRK